VLEVKILEAKYEAKLEIRGGEGIIIIVHVSPSGELGRMLSPSRLFCPASHLNFRLWASQRLNWNVGFPSDFAHSRHSSVDPTDEYIVGGLASPCTAAIIAINH